MSGLPYCGDKSENALSKVQFRESILDLQGKMEKSIERGEFESNEKDCPLTHYFTPVSEQFGCSVYAREMFIPKGALIVGKIHRHSHLNMITKGCISVSTEFGKEYYRAPVTFISAAGTKRAVLAEEDTIWTTIHLVDNPGEENVDQIVDDLTAETYAELGLIDNAKLLENE